ncbi:MAG: gliding motility-associated C-terminal domain-containing protein [Bacteroidales bacterium]|nr:gliding motility-associated C-terminal domain-containing protein [Bacteroidales bacterium]
MKDIKEILDNYNERPSEDVWSRLESRLDAEMPVRRSRNTVWKWAAIAVGIIAIGGGVAFGILRQSHHNEDLAATEITEQTVETQPQEAVVETQNVASSQTVTSSQEEESAVVVETRQGTSLQEKSPTVAETRQTSSSQPEIPAKSATKEAPKTNVRQEVLPPNSTLAKQLAADPVLRTLSDENVDWTPPAHLSIPNLFTPNGDGVNDKFVIEGLENYTSPRLVVRDKNNRIVYQSGSYQNSWDGGNCPDGVYNYEFTFLYNGIENQATGKVRIIRT